MSGFVITAAIVTAERLMRGYCVSMVPGL